MSSILGEFGDKIIDTIREALSHPKPKKVNGKQLYTDCVIRNSSGDVLLLQRALHDDFMPGKWCLPGGKIDQGEDKDVAIVREVVEETALDISANTNNFLKFLTAVEKDDCIINYYECLLSDDNQTIVLDNDEHYRCEFVPLDRINRYDLLFDLNTVFADEVEPLLTIIAEEDETIVPQDETDIGIEILPHDLIIKSFDDGLISDEDFLKHLERLKAYDTIKKAYDQELISEEQFFEHFEKAKHYEFVKVNRHGKTFFQYREVGSDKVEEDIAVGESVSGEGQLGLIIKKYSDKSILITGDTYKNLELLRSAKEAAGGYGSWNKALNGWVFPLSMKEKIMSVLATKMDISTYDETIKKQEAINLKNSVDVNTTVVVDGEETKVNSVTTGEAGEVKYEVSDGDAMKDKTEEEIGIPPANDKEAEVLINNVTEENRFKTGKQLMGKEEGEKPLSNEIEEAGQKDLKIEVKEFVSKSGYKFEGLDYTKVKHDDIILPDVETILDKPKPYYIPQINEYQFSGYNDNRFVFQAVKLEDGKYIVHLNGNDGEKKMMSYYGGNKNSRDVDVADNIAVVSLDVLVATAEYYKTKRKAELKAEADEKNRKSEEKWKATPDEEKLKRLQYWQLSDKQSKEITKQEWDILSVSEREKYIPKMKSKPYGGAKAGRITVLSDNKIPTSLFSLHEKYTDPTYRKSYGLTKADPVYAEYLETKSLIRQKGEDMEMQKEEFDNSYSKGRETSYGNSNTKDDLFDSHGVKVKRQNGDEINQKEIDEIKQHLTQVYESFGNRSSMAKAFGLKISHSGDVLMHARKAVGLYVPSMHAIGVSAKYGSDEFGFTLAHEMGHFIDNYLGKKQGRHYASDDYNSLTGRIADTYRKNMNEKSDSKYINRTCEALARSFEAYHAYKVFGDKSPYFSQPHHVNKEKFETLIKPMIEQFFNENDELLKSSFSELNIVDINNNFELIKSAFDEGDVDADKFLEAFKKYHDITKGDPSHAGKLVKKVSIDKAGKKTTKWVRREGEDEKEDKGSDKPAPVTHSKNVLAAFAKETSASELKHIINESPDEKLRVAAHAELDRREKIEKGKDKRDKKVGEEKAELNVEQFGKKIKKLMNSNEGFKLLDSDKELKGSTWDEGGCYPLALALQNVFGGKLVSINADDTVQHVMVEIDGKYLDVNGYSDSKSKLNWLKNFDSGKKGTIVEFDPEKKGSIGVGEKEMVSKIERFLYDNIKSK